jgi:hypothetical protein
MQKMLIEGIVSCSKRFTNALTRRGLSFISRHPNFRSYILALVSKVGLLNFARALHVRLIHVHLTNHVAIRASGDFFPKEIADLSPHARQIYLALNTAVEQREKKGA